MLGDSTNQVLSDFGEWLVHPSFANEHKRARKRRGGGESSHTRAESTAARTRCHSFRFTIPTTMPDFSHCLSWLDSSTRQTCMYVLAYRQPAAVISLSLSFFLSVYLILLFLPSLLRNFAYSRTLSYTTFIYVSGTLFAITILSQHSFDRFVYSNTE